MRRLFFSAVIIFIFCTAFFLWPEKEGPTGGFEFRPLYEAMELAGAEVVEGELHYWAYGDNSGEPGSGELQLDFTITEEGDGKNLPALLGRLSSLVEGEIDNHGVSFCLTGHIDRKMNAAEMEQLAKKAAAGIGGEKMRSVSDGSMVSLTAYTNRLGSPLQTEGMPVNLNIALRYNEQLGQTFIWAGTPLISRLY